MKIICEHKTGFVCNQSPMIIYDDRGRLFYVRNKTGEKKFNLPSGRYQTDNKLHKLPEPVTYLVHKLPRPEKKIPFRKLNVQIVDRPDYKARINVVDGIMQIDRRFFFLPRPVWMKVYFHEIGHHLFYSESLCDRFADICMLKMGFNPSQLIVGTLCSLSKTEENLERVKFNFMNGLNTKQKK